MESYDISAAFLQGLRFDELKQRALEFGMAIREERKVYLRPPANMWRHFRDCSWSKIRFEEHLSMFMVLLLLKAIYGLVDAPLLWQLAFILFIKEEMEGVPSLLDEHFITWIRPGWELHLAFTLHRFGHRHADVS